MSERRVASRYSQSLLSLAEEKGLLEEVNNDMQLFEAVCEENRDFLLALKNPIIQNDKKLKILKALFDKKVNELTLRFFEIISRKNRENILPDIAEAFHNQYNERKGIVIAQVVTAFPLDEKLRDQFKQVVKSHFNKEVELKEKVDDSLIGGYVLTIEDKQIDETLNGKLKQLKLEFNQKYKVFVKGI